MANEIQRSADAAAGAYPGVTYEATCVYDCFSGSADALHAAAIVRAEQLPGSLGMPKTAVTFYNGQQVPRWQRCPHDEGYLNIAARGRRFEVRRGLSVEVKAVRMSERKAEFAARSVVDAAAEEAERRERHNRWHAARMAEHTMQWMANSTKEYREKEAENLRRFVDIALHGMRPNSQSGYYIEESAIDQLTSLCDQMLKVVAEATIGFDRAHHKMVQQQCMAAIAKDDAGFQKSLSNMIEGSL